MPVSPSRCALFLFRFATYNVTGTFELVPSYTNDEHFRSARSVVIPSPRP
jgi:hypothetical protein